MVVIDLKCEVPIWLLKLSKERYKNTGNMAKVSNLFSNEKRLSDAITSYYIYAMLHRADMIILKDCHISDLYRSMM